MQVFIFSLEANIKEFKSSACFTCFSVIYQGSQQLLQFSSDSKIRKWVSREHKSTVTFLSNFSCSTAIDSNVSHCVRTVEINTVLGLPNSFHTTVITTIIKIIYNHPGKKAQFHESESQRNQSQSKGNQKKSFKDINYSTPFLVLLVFMSICYVGIHFVLPFDFVFFF